MFARDERGKRTEGEVHLHVSFALFSLAFRTDLRIERDPELNENGRNSEKTSTPGKEIRSVVYGRFNTDTPLYVGRARPSVYR